MDGALVDAAQSLLSRPEISERNRPNSFSARCIFIARRNVRVKIYRWKPISGARGQISRCVTDTVDPRSSCSYVPTFETEQRTREKERGHVNMVIKWRVGAKIDKIVLLKRTACRDAI